MAPHERTGQRVGRFRLGAMLGSGGMGTVYRASDETLGREVAVKLIRDDLVRDQSLRARFLREARAAAAVVDPAVPTVYEVGDTDGLVFIAMELVHGQNLRERLRRGPLAVPEAVRIGIAVTGALAKAHALGMVHRDLKPENILVGEQGEVNLGRALELKGSRRQACAAYGVVLQRWGESASITAAAARERAAALGCTAPP